jgi:hypothetical protein
MAAADKDEATIKELEDRRFAAVVAGDFDGFAAVCHPDLIYTHSTGVTDTLASYLEKCRSGFYVYHAVEHPVTKIEGDLEAMRADTFNGRRLPGQGDLDVRGFVDAVKSTGYDGVWGVEILSADYRKLPTEEAVPAAYRVTVQYLQ